MNSWAAFSSLCNFIWWHVAHFNVICSAALRNSATCLVLTTLLFPATVAFPAIVIKRFCWRHSRDRNCSDDVTGVKLPFFCLSWTSFLNNFELLLFLLTFMVIFGIRDKNKHLNSYLYISKLAKFHIHQCKLTDKAYG